MAGRLTRERILNSAIAYIDSCGPQSVTMRRIGSVLGVEAMALYRHVGGKERMLAGVVDKLIDDRLDDSRITAGAGSWEGYLHNVGDTMRDLEKRHPRAFPLIATHPPEAPWLRPPLRSIRWVEHFLASLLEFGFSERHAVQAYKAFTGFLLGDLLLDATSRGGEVSLMELDGEGAGVTESLGDYPTVLELQNLLSADHAEREFDDGLDDLIERIRCLDV